jgi:hypothetical protein
MADRVRIIYHHENGSWWAISPDVTDVIAVGDTREEVRQLVEEGFADEGYELVHLDAGDVPDHEPPTDARFLADLGRVATPGFLVVTGFRFEDNELEENSEAPVRVGGDDSTFG